MQGFNRVIIAGNLTRDPELRYTASGLAVAKFGVAVNRRWKSGDTGEVKDEVTFVDVDALGKSAELVGQYLKKGRPILVEGRLKQDSWEDKQTQQKKYRLYVVLESFTFLDSGQGREAGSDFNSGGPAPTTRPRPQQGAPQPASSPDPDAVPPEEDDVPF